MGFIQDKITNFKSRNLVFNVLEPLIGKNKEFCKGAVSQKGFQFISDETDILDFIRVDVTQKLKLSLTFDMNGECTYYIVWFIDNGTSPINANFVDYRLVRERGIIK